MTIKLSEEDKIKIATADDIYPIMQKILLRANKTDRDKENMWVLGLSSSNRILFIELIGLGTVNKVLVDPMDVFSIALQKRAVRVIMIHNHPSAELNPSKQDKDVTDRMIQSGKIVNTELLDHLIISEKEYFSFEDSGLMDELKLSTKYQLAEPKLEESLKELLDQRELKRSIEVAQKMLKKGIALEMVLDITGLTKDKLERSI